MKANLWFHAGNRLRIVKGEIKTRSGARPEKIYVVHYDPGLGRCKVLIHVSDEEQWEETWDLVKPDGAEGGTFRRDMDHDFDTIEVALKKS